MTPSPSSGDEQEDEDESSIPSLSDPITPDLPANGHGQIVYSEVTEDDGDEDHEILLTPFEVICLKTGRFLRSKMGQEICLLVCFVVGCLLSPFVTSQIAPPTVHRATPAATPFFGNSPLWVDDYYSGDVFAAFQVSHVINYSSCHSTLNLYRATCVYNLLCSH